MRTRPRTARIFKICLVSLLLLAWAGCKKSPTPPEVNHAPVIVQASPADSVLHLVPGQPQRFSVQASDPDGDSLRYRWTFKQTVVSTQPEFRLRAGEKGLYPVNVEVTDGRDGRAGRGWAVYVVNNTPPVVELSIQGSAAIGYHDSTLVLAQSYDLYHYPDSLVSLQLSVNDSVVASAQAADTAKIRFVFYGKDWAAGEHVLRAAASDGRAVAEKRLTVTRIALANAVVEFSPDTSVVLNPRTTAYVLHYRVIPADSTVPLYISLILKSVSQATTDTLATQLPLQGTINLTSTLQQKPDGTYLPGITATDPDQTTTQLGEPVTTDTTPPQINIQLPQNPISIDTTLTANIQDLNLASAQATITNTKTGQEYTPTTRL
ncbi:MAG: PKD domain-containing protein, partial [Calditrichaeota bacterium]